MDESQATETALCGANKRSGGTCRRSAGWGTGHVGVGRCKNHLGATPNHELHGQLILARREAAVMGTPLDADPHEAILECIRISAGEVAYASERIAELQDDQVVGPVVTTRPLKHEKGAESKTERVEEHGPPAVHIWIEVRHRAMDRLVTYSKVAIAAGIAERQVQIAERQGQLLAEVIRGILGDLGVANHPQAPAVVRKHLSLVGGRQAA